MYYTTDHFSMNKNYLQIFSGKMQNFFLSVYTCLYIHVYIYIFVLFLEKKNEKKNVSVENTKWWKKNLAAVIYFLLPDPDDVCLISAGNSELSKTSSY